MKDIVIESPEIEDNYETKENTSGRMLLSSQYRKRKITVPCYVVSTKLNDIPRLRDKFYDLTVNTEPVWIRELRYAEEHNYSFYNLPKKIINHMTNTVIQYLIII